eukprot:589611-Amphidinium_carterae.2
MSHAACDAFLDRVRVDQPDEFERRGLRGRKLGIFLRNLPEVVVLLLVVMSGKQGAPRLLFFELLWGWEVPGHPAARG